MPFTHTDVCSQKCSRWQTVETALKIMISSTVLAQAKTVDEISRDSGPVEHGNYMTALLRKLSNTKKGKATLLPL